MGLSEPDRIQGTFIGSGTGAHVCGAIALIGVSICVARGLSRLTFMKQLSWLLGALALFFITILSDAKQAILAPLLRHCQYLRASRDQLVSAQQAVLAWTCCGVAPACLSHLCSVHLYPPLQTALDWNSISQGLESKMDALFIVTKNMFHTLGGWLPSSWSGNSVSRVALMGMEGYVRDTPVAFLGLTMAPTTKAISDGKTVNAFFSSTSVASGFSSWFGQLKMLDLLVCCYTSDVPDDLERVKQHRLWQSAVAELMIMTGLLGGMYSWLGAGFHCHHRPRGRAWASVEC